MIAALDISRKLAQLDPSADRVIEVVIEPLFLNSGNHRIRILERKIAEFFMVDLHISYNRAWFITQLEHRGFVVMFDCDDRPCAEPYFEIAIPKDPDNVVHGNDIKYGRRPVL